MQTNLEYLEVQAKRIDNDNWVEGFLVLPGDHNFAVIIEKSGVFDNAIIGDDLPDGRANVNALAYIVDWQTIRRWSGQHDKNGKKIWEGDVSIHSIKGREGLVIDEETVYFICYYIVELSGFCWLTADEIEEYNSTNHQDFIEGSFCDLHTMNAYESHLVTVIGNVYDRPKYLEL